MLPEIKPALEMKLARVAHPALVPFHHTFIAPFQNTQALFAVYTMYPDAVV
jgi:hypothetical protein